MSTQQIPTSEVLDRAADLIEERGWINQRQASICGLPDTWGGGAGGDGPLCIEGGILAALGIALPLDNALGREEILTALGGCPAYWAVKNYLDHDGALWGWNDRDLSRTATEVISVLRATAVIAAARESQDAAELTYAENVRVSA